MIEPVENEGWFSFIFLFVFKTPKLWVLLVGFPVTSLSADFGLVKERGLSSINL